nr:MAG TPA: DNA POLYMERASE [Caudoviricetes sp.]
MSETILWGDLETYCEIPITNGTHAYAEGVEVMLFAWAIGDEPVSVWDADSWRTYSRQASEGYRRPRHPALFPQFAL